MYSDYLYTTVSLCIGSLHCCIHVQLTLLNPSVSPGTDSVISFTFSNFPLFVGSKFGGYYTTTLLLSLQFYYLHGELSS